jgi:4-azaleucine resistance transporter AzlC
LRALERDYLDTTSQQLDSARRGWQRGLAQVSPIVLGYIPIGFAYGVLAQEAGLSPRNTVLMSLLVYAGASQFIAAGLFASGISPLSIVLTTFVVNLRHLLMSASMAPRLHRWRKPLLAAFAYQLTDETFAVHSAQFALALPVNRIEVFCVNIVAQAAWVFGGWLGIVGGQVIPDPKPWGLDYALSAMFIALLVLQIKSRIQVGVALLAGAMAVALTLLGLGQWAVVGATVVGATIGVIWERRKEPSP